MRIIALRHGETTANRDRITQGQADTDLTENGYEQARQVAFDLKDESFDLIVSSDLKRCTETTAEVGGQAAQTTAVVAGEGVKTAATATGVLKATKIRSNTKCMEFLFIFSIKKKNFVPSRQITSSAGFTAAASR